jgi:hypothetical protein
MGIFMAVDLYSACPCGSGKKFKWCCSSVWGPIEKAYESFSKGQAVTSSLMSLTDITLHALKLTNISAQIVHKQSITLTFEKQICICSQKH